MKKLSIALAVAATMAGGTAHAYLMGVPSGGMLVPNAFHEGASNTTAIGITNHNALRNPDNTNAGTLPGEFIPQIPSVNDITVYWTFYNTNSVKLLDGTFTMTPGDRQVHTLTELLSGQFAGVRGYLTYTVGRLTGGKARPVCDFPGLVQEGELLDAPFNNIVVGGGVGGPLDWDVDGRDSVQCVDSDVGAAISGEAFQANAIAGDAEYIPTLPIVNSVDWAPGIDLRNPSPTSLRHLVSGAGVSRVLNAGINPASRDDIGDEDIDVKIDLRYALDSEFDSEIVIWGTGGLSGLHNVQIYNDQQNRRSGSINCGPNTELCLIGADTILAKPPEFTNGFIRFDVPTRRLPTNPENGNVIPQVGLWAPGEMLVSYTRVSSNSFTATQTILNSHFWLNPFGNFIVGEGGGIGGLFPQP